jgi:hypothetical protein
VSKVLAWSSNAKQNPVGAKYIIMEKVKGTELENAWPSMEPRDKLIVVKTIAEYQESWISTLFERYGSLYPGIATYAIILKS